LIIVRDLIIAEFSGRLAQVVPVLDLVAATLGTRWWET
jgi:hypothetical protein